MSGEAPWIAACIGLATPICMPLYTGGQFQNSML